MIEKADSDRVNAMALKDAFMTVVLGLVEACLGYQ
jgi:hypothetical protein